MGALSKFLRPAAYRKPELLFRPAQILRRLRWGSLKQKSELEIETAWGLRVEVSPGERIGEALAKTGSYDTAVLEALARLTEPGETCLDVGANFGLMTGVLALAAGPRGKVHAFEPHPALRQRLGQHLDRWRESRGGELARVEVHPLALSDRGATASLHIPKGFAANEGTASLEEQGEGGQTIEVEAKRLDEVFAGAEQQIGVLKIDIEGHEKAALDGAAGLLGRRAIRDVVYEDHDGYPSAVSELLEGDGYEIMLISKGLFRPALLPPQQQTDALPNYLATANPDRARARFKAMGYWVLSASALSKRHGSG